MIDQKRLDLELDRIDDFLHDARISLKTYTFPATPGQKKEGILKALAQMKKADERLTALLIDLS